MIQVEPGADYVSFSFSRDGKALPFAEWDGDEEAAIYSGLLQEFIDNGLAVADGMACHVSYDAVYAMSTGDRHALCLPDLYPYTIYIQPDGLLKDASFRYKVSYRESKMGRRFHVTRTGGVVDTGTARFLLRPDQLDLVSAVDEYNSLPAESKSFNGNLIAFSRIKELSRKARIILDKYLLNENVFVPSRLRIEIDKVGDDLFDVVPTIDAPFAGQFDRYLEAHGQCPDNIAVTEGNNGRVRVVLDEEKQKVINTIKRKYRHSTSAQLKELAEHPELELDPEQCDLSVFYSDRVIKIGVYKPKVYPFVSPYKSSWISYEVDDRVNGHTRITFKNEEEIDEFENKARRAKANGEASVSHNDILVNIDDALDIAKDARKRIAAKKEKTEKKVLIVEENAEELGYQVEHSQKDSGRKYTFDPIQGLKPDIRLKEHQVEGIAWLQHLVETKAKGCLLADDMGLGKTLQITSLIDWYDKKYPDSQKPYLIVAPVSLLENWENEYAKFFDEPRLRVFCVTAKVTKHFTRGIDKNLISFLQRHQIILTNYETVRSYQFSFAAVDYSIIVLDEAQKVKTPGTLVTNAVKALKGDFKVAMTGTPVENTMVDLWCIIDYCVPGLLGNCKEFAREYQSPLKSPDADVIALGNKVRAKMGSYFLRRLKTDVAKELPQKYVRKLEMQMPPLQRRKYDETVRQAIADRDSAAPPEGYMLTCIMKLRSISDSPYIGDDDIGSLSVDELVSSSAKLQAILPVLDEIRQRREKVILFAERRDTQAMLRKVLKVRYQVNAHIINGDTPTMRSRVLADGRLSRQQAIDDFQDRNGFNAIVMSPIAAGMGLNVVGANHVIHFSRHWNPAKENQATDRAYRIGQDKDVYVYYPMAVSSGITTFDQTLDQLLERKSQLAEATLFPSARIEVNSAELFNSIMEGSSQ